MESSLSGGAPSAGSCGESPPPSPIPPSRSRRSGEEVPVGSEEALQAAEEYHRCLSSRRRSRTVIKVLSQCCVTGTYVLNLPSNFAKTNMPQGKSSILLRSKTGKWMVKWNWTNQPMIGAGWKAFCVEHGLGKGDVVVFSKDKDDSGPISFHVKIFMRRNYLGAACDGGDGGGGPGAGAGAGTSGGGGGGGAVMPRARDSARNERGVLVTPKREDEEFDVQEVPGIPSARDSHNSHNHNHNHDHNHNHNHDHNHNHNHDHDHNHNNEELDRSPVLKRMRTIQNEWAENSSGEENDDPAPAPAPAPVAVAATEAAEAAEAAALDIDPTIAVKVKKTRSAAESEQLEVLLKVHSTKMERITRNLLGSSNSVIQGNTDGALSAMISRDELHKMLCMAFPLYDATPF